MLAIARMRAVALDAAATRRRRSRRAPRGRRAERRGPPRARPRRAPVRARSSRRKSALARRQDSATRRAPARTLGMLPSATGSREELVPALRRLRRQAANRCCGRGLARRPRSRLSSCHTALDQARARAPAPGPRPDPGHVRRRRITLAGASISHFLRSLLSIHPRLEQEARSPTLRARPSVSDRPGRPRACTTSSSAQPIAETFGHEWEVSSYDRDRVWGATSAERRSDLWKHLGVDAGWFAGKRLLDTGCGHGIVANEAAELGAEVVGMDISGSVDAAHQSSAHASCSSRATRVALRSPRARSTPSTAAAFFITHPPHTRRSRR